MPISLETPCHNQFLHTQHQHSWKLVAFLLLKKVDSLCEIISHQLPLCTILQNLFQLSPACYKKLGWAIVVNNFLYYIFGPLDPVHRLPTMNTMLVVSSFNIPASFSDVKKLSIVTLIFFIYLHKASLSWELHPQSLVDLIIRYHPFQSKVVDSTGIWIGCQPLAKTWCKPYQAYWLRTAWKGIFICTEKVVYPQIYLVQAWNM